MKRLLRILILGILLAFTGIAAHSQDVSNVKVTGHLMDSITQEPLISATVVLMQPTDSIMASFSITNSNGLYALRRVKPGIYEFQVSYVGYENISRRIEVSAGSSTMDMGNIMVSPTTEFLDQALILEERVPVRVNKDTIIYNASAFVTQPNDVVEDLLKKMPGIEVESDGTILAEGEEVEQVLVDGKDFFGNDPKVATKNLPARAIKEVQVFDKKSDMAKFSGIDDGIRSKTINLKLKEDYKKGVFGNVAAGYGTEDRYNGKFNINTFDKKNKLSALGQINNINEQGFSVNEYINFMGGMSNLMRSGAIRINSGSSAVPISNGLSDGDTKTNGIGLNFNRDFTKKTRLNATYFYNSIDNLTNQEINRNYFQREGDFSTDETDVTSSENQNHRISAKFDHEIDSTQSIRATASLSFNDLTYSTYLQNKTLSADNILQNESMIDNSAEGTSQNINTRLTYRKKFPKKGRSIVGEFTFSNAPTEQDAELRSLNTFYDDFNVNVDSIFQDQLEDKEEQELGFSSTWTEPLGGRKYLGLTYSYNINNNDTKKDVYDLDTELDPTYNTLLSNAYDQRIQTQRAEASFRWIFEKSNLNVRLGVQQSNLDGEITSSGVNISEDYTHLLPSLQWNYDFSRTKGVSVNYKTNINQPSLYQLQPIVDNSDPLNIYVGNPNLDPEYRHNVRLRFRNFSQFANTSLFAHINLTLTENKITNATSINEQFVKIVRPVNIDQNFRGSGWISYSAPLRFIDSRINLSTNMTYNDGVTFINNEENDTENLSNSFSLSLENKKKEILDWSLGMDYSRSNTTYSTSSRDDQRYYNQTYWVDATATFGTWSLQSGMDVNIYNGNLTDDSQTIPIWTASLSKFIFNQKAELKVTAFDILDENEGYQQNIDLNYIEEIRSNSIGQYFMLHFIYQIGSFKQNAFQRTGPGSHRRR